MSDRAQRQQRRPRLVARIGILLFGVAVGLAATEILLRIGAAYIGATEHTETAAWRSERHRVVCLGDSNMYGLWVKRNQTFPYYLEQIWNAAVPNTPVEVLNLAFPGLNSSKLRRSFRPLMDALRPDLVIVLVGSNDINSVPVPVDDSNAGGLSYRLWQRSRVFRLLYMLVAGVRQGQVDVEMRYTGHSRRGVVRVDGGTFDLAGTDRLESGLLPNWESGLNENLHAMWGAAVGVGAEFVVLTYPSHQTLYGTANQQLLTFDLPLIDLASLFRLVCPSGTCPNIFLKDQHPNVAGYQLMAALVFGQLWELGLVAPTDIFAGFAVLDKPVQSYIGQVIMARQQGRP